MEVRDIRGLTEAIRSEIGKAVVGQDDVIDLTLTSLLVNGHVLLEGVPGTAKTLMVRTIVMYLAINKMLLSGLRGPTSASKRRLS